MGTTAKRVGNGFTYADYLTWPDDERWEIINGVAYAMTPAPTLKHPRAGEAVVRRAREVRCQARPQTGTQCRALSGSDHHRRACGADGGCTS